MRVSISSPWCFFKWLKKKQKKTTGAISVICLKSISETVSLSSSHTQFLSLIVANCILTFRGIPDIQTRLQDDLSVCSRVSSDLLPLVRRAPLRSAPGSTRDCCCRFCTSPIFFFRDESTVIGSVSAESLLSAGFWSCVHTLNIVQALIAQRSGAVITNRRWDLGPRRPERLLNTKCNNSFWLKIFKLQIHRTLFFLYLYRCYFSLAF